MVGVVFLFQSLADKNGHKSVGGYKLRRMDPRSHCQRTMFRALIRAAWDAMILHPARADCRDFALADSWSLPDKGLEAKFHMVPEAYGGMEARLQDAAHLGSFFLAE